MITGIGDLCPVMYPKKHYIERPLDIHRQSERCARIDRVHDTRAHIYYKKVGTPSLQRVFGQI